MDRKLAYHYSVYLRLMGLDDSEFRADGIYWKEDASSRLAFGLCKKYGIDTTGMNPKEAWEALREKTGKSASDFYNGSGEKGNDKIRFNTANVKTFTRALDKAKKAQEKEKQWRVTGLSRDELREWHPNAKLHVTDGGSTIAIDNGDIVGVCKNPDDSVRGSELIAFAVKNGAKKLDSYEGNHEFYVRCGFEPVSWCKWDDEYAPDGWDESRDGREDIVFYKYVGKGNAKIDTMDALREWKKKTKPGKDYDTAMSMRDSDLERSIRMHNERVR